jgi:ribonucleoside-triphosphate reductase (thioredoxin)
MELSPLQELVFYRTYSRWQDELGRRETWEEAVDRYFKYFEAKFGEKVPAKVFKKARKNTLTMGAMPSMRAFWTAGPALDASHVAGYNCCYLAMKDLRSPVELFYILMCGTGVGFSIEREYISQMPEVQRQLGNGAGVHVVGDSKEGWADSLSVGLNWWFSGLDVEFDYSKVRPRGSRLKTMGGRASGPEPLRELHKFVRTVILGAQGRKLTSVEWLDIGNKIAEVVVVGGVRRSSEITFSDLEDIDIRDAKDFSKGAFPVHRYMSNNSAVYHAKPDAVTFLKEWTALAASGAGERGIFNASATTHYAPRRKARKSLRCNPCGEILLRDSQFCNLTEVVVRDDDTFATLSDKVKSAVWMGAMQSCLTDFPYLRPEFKINCEEERLLGVSLTGQMDNPKLLTAERLSDLREIALDETEKACKALDINMSVAVTTGKPSGTVSQLVDSASGAHPRFAKYYIRRVRISATDPLCRMLKAAGVPMSPENGQGPSKVDTKRKHLMEAYGRDESEAKLLIPDWDESQVDTWVLRFPEKAPDGAITRDDMTALEQLEWYKKVRSNWCEHNQSITVYVRDDEWVKVGSWVLDNFDFISGVSFLPYDGGKYEQAPYEEITKHVYNKLVEEFPEIDYGKLAAFEIEDNTTGAQSYACTAAGCEMP